MTKPILRNKKINNLWGVCDVLRAIDLERMQPMGMKGKFVVYMAYPTMNQSFTARFHGSLEAECLQKREAFREYGNYKLPHAEYIRKQAGVKNVHYEDRTPSEMP